MAHTRRRRVPEAPRVVKGRDPRSPVLLIVGPISQEEQGRRISMCAHHAQVRPRSLRLVRISFDWFGGEREISRANGVSPWHFAQKMGYCRAEFDDDHTEIPWYDEIRDGFERDHDFQIARVAAVVVKGYPALLEDLRLEVFHADQRSNTGTPPECLTDVALCYVGYFIALRASCVRAP